MERRLAAILAADVVGFSRLMGEDEAGTLSSLETLTAEVLTPLIAKHHGRIVKVMGDGFLVEFASVVDALACALAWQDKMEEGINPAASKPALRFRIGVNLGDVIVRGDDIYGDGVNVATRLEAMAEPGSVLVSRTVYNHTHGKLTANFEDLGEKRLKNIPNPIRVYRAANAEDFPARRADINRGAKVTYAAAIAATLMIAVGGAVWLQPWEAREQLAMVEAMALPLPDKPSIAVLPFDDMSDGTVQEYFADGMTEDLITDLSKISGLFVIARHTTFAYKGKTPTVKKVSEDLGVRFVLEGSVRRAGNTLRVNAQLIDATTGGHVWADRFDGDISDVFAVQDEFVLRIVNALELELTETERGEIEKSETQTVEAREAFQRGWDLYSRFNEQDSVKSVPFFEKAIELDPEYGRAYGALALVYQRNGLLRWNHDPSVPRNQVYIQFVRPYLDLAGPHPTALIHVVQAMRHLNFRGQVTSKTGGRRTEQARIEAGYAIALQPNDPEAHITMAWALISGGRSQEALHFIEAAKRLNPNQPSYYFLFEAAANFGLGDLTSAASILKQGMALHRNASELAPFAASVNAQLGNRQEANEIIRIWFPGQYEEDRILAAAKYYPPIQWDIENDQLNEKLAAGLRLAALPLEVSVISLRANLRRQDPSEQISTIRTLGWFGSAAAPAVPDLVEALGSTRNRVRREAAITLGYIGPAAESAIPVLKAIVDQPIVGFHAKAALAKITDN